MENMYLYQMGVCVSSPHYCTVLFKRFHPFPYSLNKGMKIGSQ